VAQGGGNLVLALLVLGGAGVAIWAGITDPDGGVREGIRRAMTGTPGTKRTGAAGGVSFTTTLASLTTGAGTSGGGGQAGGGRYSLGGVKPHVAAAAAEIGGRFNIGTVYGFSVRNVAGTTTLSDHALGLALDFMTRNGDGLAAYAQANAARLGVTYVIWNRRIWSVGRADEGWRTYYGVSPHTDHVHVSFKGNGGAVST
jgi:hypothetical protein